MKYIGLHTNTNTSQPLFNCAINLVLNQIEIKKKSLRANFVKKHACNYRRINICHKMCTRY